APVANLVLVIGSIMGERFLYLPSIGLAACVAFGLVAAWRKWIAPGPSTYRYVAATALAIGLMTLAARTNTRNDEWLDPSRFWRTAANASQNSYKTHLSVAGNLPGLTPDDFDH